MNFNQSVTDFIVNKSEVTTKDIENLYQNMTAKVVSAMKELVPKFPSTSVGSNDSFEALDNIEVLVAILSKCTYGACGVYCLPCTVSNVVRDSNVKLIVDEIASLENKLNEIV